ncbi:MAG: methyltransferase domain-containing protein [Alphaproteobacteria bacterium]|nr:methyltransferase domain-containing protein [Alphaproteobacteria bacterium]
MSTSDKKFAGSIPEIYDTYFVPLIFEPYAVDLAQRVAEAKPKDVLETAAGSGVVPRVLAPLLSPDARYVVTDLNQPMLDRAMVRQTKDDRIIWRQADALLLPFGDKSFDAVCCQFGAMFFPNKAAGYRETLRVLKTGGRFVFNVWDGIEDNIFARVVTDAAAQIFPDDPPLFFERTPHGYHDVKQIEADVRAGGFRSVEIVTLTKMARAESPRHVAVAFTQGSPFRNEIEQRDASKLEAVTALATEMIARAFGTGRVEGKMQAHVVTARAD